MIDRTGEVWEDRESRGWTAFVVVGAPQPWEGGWRHPALVLTDDRGRVLWNESSGDLWEREQWRGMMRRIA